MTTLDQAVRARHPGARNWLGSLLRRGNLVAVGVVAALALGLWAAAMQPVSMPGYSGRIGGYAFSPFRRGQSPETDTAPLRSDIRADLEQVAQTTRRIRTYTAQGVQGEIPRLAEGLPLRITAGAWLDGHTQADTAELSRLIALARGSRNIERLLVGNETILRKDLSVDQLIAYIRRVKEAVSLPVSTAEPWHVWLAHPELAQSVDFITIHLLPYWEGVPEDRAIGVIMQRLDQVAAAFPGKPIVIGEVGWPSDGVDIGAAHAGVVAQASFLRRFFAEAQARHLDYFVMEAFDQPWKTSFEGRAAGYWGMYDLDREAKWPMTGAVSPLPDWPLWALPEIAIAALLTLGLLSRRPDISLTGKLAFSALVQGFVAGITCVLLAMSAKYLSAAAACVWGALAAGQVVLLVLLLADGFELAETVWARAPARRYRPRPAPSGETLPKVSLHLPICNEPPELVRATLDALAALDYPDFEVLVVDNNTVDPALWEPVAEHCARLGGRFRFFHLGRWPGFKAGALNFALRETAADAEIVGVLDSDYVVAPDWLRCMAPAFADPRVGFAQSPQDYRDAGESLFKRLMFWEYAGFFQLGMVTRDSRNAIIQHGTMTLIRRQALAAEDGWAEWCITEDAELGLRLFRAGWDAVYAAESFGRGVMPDDFAAYRSQRFRWAYGAMRIGRRHARALLSPFDRTLTAGQRWHFVTGWLPWVGDALGLAFTLLGLGWSIGLVAAPMTYEFPIVLFMLPCLLLFGFKLAQIALLYRARVACGWRDRLGAAVAGLALSHTIGTAVWRGMLGLRTPFRRTPKLRDAPALIQGVAMARQEAAMLVLCWSGLVAVGVAHGVFAGRGTWEAVLWCLVLATQSLPYLAAVSVSVIAALPSRALAGVPISAVPDGIGAALQAGD